jgi:hypothetical protein
MFLPIAKANWTCDCGAQRHLLYDADNLRFLTCFQCDKEKIEERCGDTVRVCEPDSTFLRAVGVRL